MRPWKRQRRLGDRDPGGKAWWRNTIQDPSILQQAKDEDEKEGYVPTPYSDSMLKGGTERMTTGLKHAMGLEGPSALPAAVAFHVARRKSRNSATPSCNAGE